MTAIEPLHVLIAGGGLSGPHRGQPVGGALAGHGQRNDAPAS